jgi:hypothetical protein
MFDNDVSILRKFAFLALFSYSFSLRAVYPNIFSLPYPLIRLLIYEYPLSSLLPSIPQKSVLIFLG